MSRKAERWLYAGMSVFGIALVLFATLILKNVLSDSQSGIMIGAGAGLFGIGVSKWAIQLWGEKNPELMKQNEIEARDERNQWIRLKARAICGEVLHWLLMVGAWIGIAVNAPMWVILLLTGIFLLKTILELLLMAYYQRIM